MRLKIIRIIVTVLFVILAVDLIHIQALQGRNYFSLSVNNRIRVIPLEGQRGRIFDRNGELLADNRLSFNATVIPQDVLDQNALFLFLSRVLKSDQQKLLALFQQKRDAPFAPVVIAEDIDQQTAMVLEENKFRFPGLHIQENFRRWYPGGEIGAHVLGYVGKIDSLKIKKLKEYGYSQQSMVGYSGVEEYYDQYLKGTEGGVQIEVNSRGQQVRLLGIREPERGKDIQLTIDSRLQKAASDALAGHHGVIVAMDLDSGEILGLVSSPSFDPNIFSDEKRRREKGPVIKDPASPLLNRAIKGQYPPGSIFKTVVSVAGLSTGKIDTKTSFHCPGFYTLGRRRFRCAHVHYDLRIVEAIGQSCNVFFYNVGSILGPDVMHRYARMFGLGEETRIDLPAEESGRVPSRALRRKQNSDWYKGDTLNFSIGQGDVLATPIQVTRLMATLARSGRVVQPHLLKAIGEEQFVKLAVVKALKVDQQVFDTLHEGMRAAVAGEHGTSRLLDMRGFEVYGKTGTAQTVPGKDAHAWFAGYNLTGQKRIAFCVFLEYGGSSYYAVRVAQGFLKTLKTEKIFFD